VRCSAAVGRTGLKVNLSDLVTKASPIEFVVVVYAILRTLLIASAALPAVWSKDPQRRRAALAVLRTLLRVRASRDSLPAASKPGSRPPVVIPGKVSEVQDTDELLGEVE
jgi:hypothetical protein